MAKVGERVRFLNSVGGGRIVRIERDMAYVEEDDGFITPILVKECVVVNEPVVVKSAQPKPSTTKADTAQADSSASRSAAQGNAMEIEYDYEEVEGNESLNLVIGFEASDLKKLSESTFEAYLVNDSNYFVSFAWMTRANEDELWTLRKAETVEPNTEILLGDILREDLPYMDRMQLHYIAYKLCKPFAPKNPECVEVSLDTTKFAKYHCFQANQYFENPVIAIDLVRYDQPANKPFYPAESVDAKAVAEAMKQKRPERRKISRPTPVPQELVVDLHIDELVDNKNGLSKADILNIQVDRFRAIMDANLRHKGMKIVFIHGKGEGVLRHALLKELSHRYKYHEVQDASFEKYGFGATQVTIK